MCGIVGCIGNMGKPENKAFEELLFVDTLRGADSTGVISVNYQDKASSFKRAYPAQDFLSMKQAASLIFSGKVLIGHNRWATKGAVNHLNAHPFEHGDVIGVHNGTIRNQSLLTDHKDFPVDSDNVFYSIDKLGIEKTIASLDGAYALVWYDKKEKKVNIIRNKERTLFYTFTDKSKQLFFASEEWMLYGILGRNGIKHGKILPFQENQLYTFSMPEKGAVNGASLRKIKEYVRPPVNNNVSRFYPNHQQNASTSKYKSASEFLGKFQDFTVGAVYGSGDFRYMSLIPADNLTVGKDTYLVRMFDHNKFAFLAEAKKKGLKVRAQLNNYISGLTEVRYISVVSESLSYVEEAKEEPKTGSPFRYKGFDGSLLDEKQWLRATSKGCVWCASPPNKDEELVWLSGNEFVCSDCADFDEVKQYLV